ncbi:MAG: M50 family metallopeptidase [Limnochordia bacterium]|jgi:stage IV sporulation protein FB|nr:peptidase M50 [Bacillota bacterium]
MKFLQAGGIRFLLNPYFLILLAVLSFVGLLVPTLFIFFLVLLHELGHVIMAQSFGLRVQEVELLPFGGVARIDGLLEADPFVEICVALAGPLTSLFLAGLSYYLLLIEALPSAWLELSLRSNLAIGLVNLLPAMPLDGGRCWRARLTRVMGYREATIRAARLGKGLAIILGCIGTYEFLCHRRYPGLLVMAFFLFYSAGREQGMAIYVLMRSLARKKQELMEKKVIGAQPLVARGTIPLKELIKHLSPQKYSVITVVDEAGRILGSITETEVLDGLLQVGVETPLEGLLRHRC